MAGVEIGLSVVDWIALAQDRYRWRALVNAVMNLRALQNAGKLPSGCTTGDISSRAHPVFFWGGGAQGAPILDLDL
jgi:hypothetical protein